MDNDHVHPIFRDILNSFLPKPYGKPAPRYDMTQPCRAKSQKCGAAGECLRCSADQGVACGDDDPFIDPSKTGMFRDHRCTRCNDGAKPCPDGQTGPSRSCGHPHARND